jgi:hypothetical protein
MIAIMQFCERDAKYLIPFTKKNLTSVSRTEYRKTEWTEETKTLP